ncbi:MAG: sulfite exporter TauE/SafE family protein [Planctomycetota bacterium]|jgi:hypothetical protein|nr:sulfite exporter TauE/SafE family protein [Planctomycetota bacterium]
MNYRLAIVSVLAGLASGLLGVGGGLVVGPALVLVGFSLPRATGTAVTVIPFVAAISVLFEFVVASQNFSWQAPLLIFVGGQLGVFVGHRVWQKLGSSALHYLFVTLLFSAAIYNFNSALNNQFQPLVNYDFKLDVSASLLLVVSSVLAGVSAVLFGIGGGIIMVPVMVYGIEGVGFAQASALSLLAMIPVAISAAIKAKQQGRADWHVAKTLIGICSLAAMAGVYLRNFAFNHQQLQTCFAVFLIYVGLRIFRRGPTPGT